MDFPRVVILSMTDISSSTATGSLLRELFAAFPPDNIFQISAQTSEDETAQKYLNHCEIPNTRLWLRACNRILPRKWSFKTFGMYQSNLLEKVSAFNPDLIYIRIVDNLNAYRVTAELISEQHGIPIVTHIMDDYELLLQHSPNPIKRVVSRFFLRKDLNFLFGIAKSNFAISNSMSSAFEDKYGYRFEVFHNGIDPAEWQVDVGAKQKSSFPENTCIPFRIVMAGSIDKKKDAEAITQVCKVVHALNKSGDLKCEFILNVSTFFLPIAMQLSDSYLGVIAQEYQPLKKYRELLSTADCLLLARNSDEATRAYTSHSFHNKLPEYLASGTLVLCIGPDWDSSVKFLDENQCGVVVTSATDAEIREKIRSIAKCPERYIEYSTKAKKIAFEKFDIRSTRARFNQRLCEIADVSHQ